MATWIRACAVGDVEAEDLIQFNHEGFIYAVYHAPDGTFYATAGRCTHQGVNLCDGLVMGHLVECPKHNGRFDYRTGKAVRAPATVDLRTFPVKVEGGEVFIDVD